MALDALLLFRQGIIAVAFPWLSNRLCPVVQFGSNGSFWEEYGGSRMADLGAQSGRFLQGQPYSSFGPKELGGLYGLISKPRSER